LAISRTGDPCVAALGPGIGRRSEPTEGGEMATLASLMLPTGATIVIPGIIVLIIIVVIVLWILF